MPKLAWDRFEEGKMNAIAKDILTGTITSDDYEKKRTTVAKNTAIYIQEENAGHRRYGYGYLFAQVDAIVYIYYTYVHILTSPRLCAIGSGRQFEIFNAPIRKILKFSQPTSAFISKVTTMESSNVILLLQIGINKSLTWKNFLLFCLFFE